MKLLFLILTFTILFLTGCSPTYNIEPSYNKEKKTIMIDDYKIKDAVFNMTKQTLNINTVNQIYKIFKSKDNKCKKLAYRTLSVGTNRYYYNSAIDDILFDYNNNCEVDKIGNINFFKCFSKSTLKKKTISFILTNINYGLTMSTKNEYGYSDKTTIYLGNNTSCFEDIKMHFKNKTKPEYIEVVQKAKTYIFN